MKKMYKIATVLLAFCFLLGSVPVSVKAEDYKYQVTIFSGVIDRDPFPELQV